MTQSDKWHYISFSGNAVPNLEKGNEKAGPLPVNLSLTYDESIQTPLGDYLSMIEANALRKGTTFTQNDDLFKVLDYSHNKTARGGATIRVKVRNLRTGSTTEKTFNGGERVQDVRLEHREAEYLYNDGSLYYFMDKETYEQPAINQDILTDIIPYLTENMQVKISSYLDEPIEIEIPVTVELEVTHTEPGFAGDTATGATKPATLSTGLQVQTPLFINIGDMVRVDTRTGEYITRV